MIHMVDIRRAEDDKNIIKQIPPLGNTVSNKTLINWMRLELETLAQLNIFDKITEIREDGYDSDNAYFILIMPQSPVWYGIGNHLEKLDYYVDRIEPFTSDLVKVKLRKSFESMRKIHGQRFVIDNKLVTRFNI